MENKNMYAPYEYRGHIGQGTYGYVSKVFHPTE